MSIDRIIRCDECDTHGPPEMIGASTGQTRDLAKMEGWECRGRYADICPSCISREASLLGERRIGQAWPPVPYRV